MSARANEAQNALLRFIGDDPKPVADALAALRENGLSPAEARGALRDMVDRGVVQFDRNMRVARRTE
jgi:hypothetical protein